MLTVKFSRLLCNDSSYSGIPATLLFCIFLWVLGAIVPDFNSYDRAITIDDAVKRYTTGNLGNQLFWGGAFLIALYLTFKVKAISSVLINSFVPLITLISIAVVSCLWSIEPGTSLRRVILQIFVCYSLIAVVFALPDHKVVLNIIYKALCVVLFYDFIALVIMPWDHFYGFPGIHGHKNSMGTIAAIALYVGAWSYSTGKRNVSLYGYFISWSLLIVLSMSKTSIILFFIPIILYGFSISLKKILRSVYGILFFGAGGLFLSILFIVAIGIDEFNLSDLVSLLDDDVLTGRGYIWKYMLSIIYDNGALGFGYAAFWGTEYASFSAGLVSRLNQTHNGYIDLLVQFGLLGYLLILGFLIEASRILHRASADIGLYFITFCMVMFLLLHNLTESTLFRSTSILWLMLLVFYLLSHKANLLKSSFDRSIT